MFFISDPSDTANLAQQQGLNKIRKPRCLLFRSLSSFVIPPAGMNFDSDDFGNLTKFFSQLLMAIWNKDKFSVDGKVLNLLTNKKKTDYFVNPVNFMVSSESIFFSFTFTDKLSYYLHQSGGDCIWFHVFVSLKLRKKIFCQECWSVAFVCLSVCLSVSHTIFGHSFQAIILNFFVYKWPTKKSNAQF